MSSLVIDIEKIEKKKLSLVEVENKLIFGDVLDGLRLIPDGSVSLIFTSPPYNVDIKYGNRNDKDAWISYLDWLNDIWIECHRVLRSGGRLCINIDAIVNHEADKDTEYRRPIYADLVNQMRNINGMNFRGDICWYKHQVVGRATAWGSYDSCSNPAIRRNHEYIIIWSKDSWKLEGDSEQSDMTEEEFQEWSMSFWHITPETRNLGNHPVPFSEELSTRIIKMNSYRGDLVLDPFSGSGTVAAIAAGLNRRFIGIDNHKPYIEYSERRIKQQLSSAIEEEYVVRSERLKNSKKNQKSGMNADISFE